GQNLLPESHAIAESYKRLYGSTSPSLQAITGVDWMIAAQTPFPRLRADNNLVIPEDKLPQEEVSDTTTSDNDNDNATTYTYVCRDTSAKYYLPSFSSFSSATRFTTTNSSSTPGCDSTYPDAQFI
ncbi:MAG: hypothetical protein O2929_00430, partial [Cyanobacteria bacterium]|nr:hypothetical protein [Cyanobacteriota bacterium]